MSKYGCVYPRDRLEDTEISLRGLQMALTCIPSFPVRLVKGELNKDSLLRLEHQMNLNLSTTCDSISVPDESKAKKASSTP